MKKSVGLVVYDSGDHIQMTYIPIIGEVEFQFCNDQTKPTLKYSYAMVLEKNVYSEEQESSFF